jgi:hypothetical protein
VQADGSPEAAAHAPPIIRLVAREESSKGSRCVPTPTIQGRWVARAATKAVVGLSVRFSVSWKCYVLLYTAVRTTSNRSNMGRGAGICCRPETGFSLTFRCTSHASFRLYALCLRSARPWGGRPCGGAGAHRLADVVPPASACAADQDSGQLSHHVFHCSTLVGHGHTRGNRGGLDRTGKPLQLRFATHRLSALLEQVD